jgi:ABC-type antimicrobial peptide transport system permease subunit
MYNPERTIYMDFIFSAGVFGGLSALIGMIFSFFILKVFKKSTTEQVFSQHSKLFYSIMAGVMMLCYMARAAIL